MAKYGSPRKIRAIELEINIIFLSKISKGISVSTSVNAEDKNISIIGIERREIYNNSLRCLFIIDFLYNKFNLKYPFV
tara:strand:- start:276 stop:509 length:234 start_codon:yes stop_codon:yes gene_type:complete